LEVILPTAINLISFVYPFFPLKATIIVGQYYLAAL